MKKLVTILLFLLVAQVSGQKYKMEVLRWDTTSVAPANPYPGWEYRDDNFEPKIWDGTQWKSFTGNQDPSVSSDTGNLIIEGTDGGAYLNSVNDGDSSSTNEIQTLTSNGSAGNITISSGNTINLNVNDLDADPNNEIQNIATNNTPGNIAISGGANLTLNVDDADSSTTNEIQSISTNGNPGNITLSSSNTLNLNVNDGDSSSTNEIQNLSSVLGQGTAANAKITSLTTPTANNDAANKIYVDNQVATAVNTLEYRAGFDIPVQADFDWANALPLSTGKLFLDGDSEHLYFYVNGDFIRLANFSNIPTNTVSATSGTFTPTFIDTGGGATYSITVNYADYYKVGNRVDFTIDITVNSTTGTRTGVVEIRNLPFAVKTSRSYACNLQIGGVGFNFYSAKSVVTSTNNAIGFTFQTAFDDTENNGISSATLTGTTMLITGTYITN